MPTRVQLTVNGSSRQIADPEGRTLLEVLREDLGLTGVKFGCGEGHCRACTVLVDGQPERSCQLAVRDVADRALLTIEGLAPSADTHHPVQQAFLDEEAMQCGYCVPGMILATVGLLDEHPTPTDDEIVTALDGHLCRCCGYVRILRAVRRAAALLARSGESR